MIRQTAALIIGKAVGQFSRLLNLGAGGTWPGELALSIDPHILKNLAGHIRKGIVIVAGTNGKTTTTLMIKTILEANGNSVINNSSGANLINGITASLIRQADIWGRLNCDYAVLETDENSLPAIVEEITPNAVVCLNLFRDQLDRYGEVDVITEKWALAIKNMNKKTALILNSDDPQIAFLGKKYAGKTVYFGLNVKKLQKYSFEHATDSIFCPNCGRRLKFAAIYYSHLGWWQCLKCGLKRPDPEFFNWESPLPGLYNKYNTQAAAAVAKTLGVEDGLIAKSLKKVSPAFGRQEELVHQGKPLKLMLSKNPAGFNESLRTVIGLKAKNILLVLNDRIPDGRDVSWIWDVDFEMIPAKVQITVAGDRALDLGLRMKYAGLKYAVETVLSNAINKAAGQAEEKLYVLPTYSAMLDIRKIICGKKIL